jgi:hypothetical protein
MRRSVRQRPPLRGGWDVDCDEFKSLGFTVGLPPSLYVPRVPIITELSQRFESSDSLFLDIDSNFSVEDRSFFFHDSRNIRCFVRDLPPGMDSQKLKRIINQKMYQKKLTSTPESVERVLVNPCGQFAFVDFPKSRDAERFLELKDSLEIEGQPVKIRRSFKSAGTAGQPNNDFHPERRNSLILWGIEITFTEKEVREIVSRFAKVGRVDVPTLYGVNLGYAIVDLEDSILTDLVALHLRVKLGIDCRRCFSRFGQRQRKENSAVDFAGLRAGKKITKLVESARDFTVADVLNLDIDIARIANEREEGVNEEFNGIRIFSLTKSADPKELEIVVEEVRRELRHFRSLLKVFADLLFDQGVPLLGVSVVAVFKLNREAALAQIEISGRKYRGRIVITMLENIKI